MKKKMLNCTQQHQMLLTVKAAAKALSISERKLWQITAPRGPLPTVRIGRSVRYRIRDLEDWADANTVVQKA